MDQLLLGENEHLTIRAKWINWLSVDNRSTSCQCNIYKIAISGQKNQLLLGENNQLTTSVNGSIGYQMKFDQPAVSAT